MSKHNILFDWEPPRPGKDEGAAVQKVVAEIERNVPGYEPPTPISADERKDMPKAARRREKEREAEHAAALDALEDQEKQLRRQEQRLARQAKQQETEQHRLQQREREQKDRQREQQQRDASERRRLTALEREWGNFKIHAARAQHEQQREAYFQDLQATVDGLNRMANPPRAAEQIVYVESEDEPGAGALPTLPRWR
jgi:chromosome segregation ATPase